ncbi:MAG: protein kinase, partial [Planctomycetes bacterium]|nr:protein kinase [Planctomycetota bacterium]
MAAPADLRLALTALRKGLITRDQLSTFLAEREGDAPGPALAQQLVERGILTAEQVRALEAEAVPGGAADAQTMVADGLPLPRGPGQGVDYRTKVGEYSLIKVLGRGGMGVVYQAEHEALRRKVALKVLPPAFSRDERALARFLREVRAAARLHHTGIVPIYDFGRDGDTYFFAMEFVEGPTLEQELERGALEPKRAARLLAQAAEALHVAHLEGIVHRDIKPSNLIIAAGDRIVITDFGIAREITESGLTASGSMLGTPYYMSPEQASGTHGLPDARSDVYSLGATLYEAATAHKAFEAPSFELVLARVLLAEPDPPRTHRPDLPRDLETVTLKAMAKDAGLRSQTALELAEDLRRFERGEPVLARSVTRIERIGRTLRRLRSHRGVLLAAALALGALGSLAVRLGVERSQLETEKAAEAERA